MKYLSDNHKTECRVTKELRPQETCQSDKIPARMNHTGPKILEDLERQPNQLLPLDIPSSLAPITWLGPISWLSPIARLGPIPWLGPLISRLFPSSLGIGDVIILVTRNQ